jgi:hypothetical protein
MSSFKARMYPVLFAAIAVVAASGGAFRLG